MIIREMKSADLDQVMEIEHEAFSDHWKRSAYEYELNENEFSHLIVAEENGEIIGVAGYYILFDDAQVTTIATRQSKRKQGVATRLMESLLNDCDEKGCCTCSLEVRVSNHSAIKLYEKFEFIKVNVRKGYYEDGEDADLMVKAMGGNYE